MAKAGRAAAASQGAGETREGILRAALRAFAEKGYDGASTREIATAAGVNHGLIPYYFGSKEKLWREAVDLAFGELASGMQALLGDATLRDDRERAARMIREHVRFVAAHPEFVRLMHDEGKRRGPRMRWIVDRHVKPLFEATTKLLEAAGRGSSGRLAEIPPVSFFYIMAGATGLIFHQAEECRRLAGVDPFDPQVVDDHARAVEWFLLGPPPVAEAGELGVLGEGEGR